MKKDIKSNNYIMINKKEFNVKGIVDNKFINSLKFDRLENCYNKPSDTKISIYYSWYYTYLDNIYILEFGVGSYNTNIFTINSIVEIDNKQYYLHITPSKNECYEVVNC